MGYQRGQLQFRSVWKIGYPEQLQLLVFLFVLKLQLVLTLEQRVQQFMYLQARGFFWRLIVPVRWPDETSTGKRRCSINWQTQPLVVHEREQPNYFACQLLMDMQCHNQTVFVKWKQSYLAKQWNTIFVFISSKALGVFFYFQVMYFKGSLCLAFLNFMLTSHTIVFPIVLSLWIRSPLQLVPSFPICSWHTLLTSFLKSTGLAWRSRQSPF